MSLPHIFIASSTRSLIRAQVIAKSLEGIATVLVWSRAFTAGEETLRSLREHAHSTDFAIFLFTKDDNVTAIGDTLVQSSEKSRDNVIFEFGLFSGVLGSNRIFTVCESGTVLPSDLKSMVVDAIFKSYNDLSEHACAAELKDACMKIEARLNEIFTSQILNFCREASNELRATLRRLNKLVQNQVLNTGETFRIGLADRLVEEARVELKQALSSGSYVSEISLEKSFLNRAAQIFEQE